jgi:hypothetical protein
MKKFFPLLLILLFMFPLGLWAQKKKLVLIRQADLLRSEVWGDTTVNILVGRVILEHDGALMYCDSAYRYEEINSFDAFGNIHIHVRDSLDLYSDVLFYDGNTKLAEMHYNVRLVDKTTTLFTEHLFYDRVIKRAHYPDSGRIVDKDNVLTSRNGYYFTEPRIFQFRHQVKLKNPDYVLTGDSLDYSAGSKTAFVKGPTEIVGKEKYIYTEDGWYDTRTETASLKTKVFIRNKDRTLTADSVFYRDKPGFARAFRKITAHDTTRRVILKGDFAEYNDSLGYVFVTQNALALYYEKNKPEDTLYLHADTLHLTFDTAREARWFYAWKHVKFFRNDLQGMCDSLVYYHPDSVFTMYGQPTLWRDSVQLTSDSIRVWTSNQRPDSMYMFNSAFIIQLDDSLNFNQMRGRDMKAYFKEGDLRKVVITGNAETIYYLREDDGNLIGINNTAASNMYMWIEKNEVTDIIYQVNPEGATYPRSQLPADKQKLKGFEWRWERRPAQPMEVLKW